MSDRPATQTEMIQFKAADLRDVLLNIEQQVLAFKAYATGCHELDEETDKGEVIANITLAYRHLEDARMRLGKVLQAADGGTSIYDKTAEEEVKRG